MNNKSEEEILPIIEKLYKTKFIKTKRYDIFDFISEGDFFYIEVKGRTNKKNKYPSTMIGYNKILKGLELLQQLKKVIFFFRFTDIICYFELTENNIKEEYIKSYNFKKYCYIPIEKLINLNKT
jgi:hypothetical protein